MIKAKEKSKIKNKETKKPETQVKELSLSVYPRGKQVDLYKTKGRFCVFSTGRQFGKTTIVLLRLFVRAVSKKGVYWWVSPVYSQCRVVFRRFLENYSKFLTYVNRSSFECHLLNGSIVQFRSGESKENLRGESLNGVAIDEAALLHPEFFDTLIRPMLTATNGWADIISTPRGKNWFHDLYMYALTDRSVYNCFHATSYESPFITKQELDSIKLKTPEILFRQEYLAEFVDDSGYVFQNVKELAYGRFEPYDERNFYVAGLDLARLQDYTVLTIFKVTEHSYSLVDMLRFNTISWTMQANKIVEKLKQYGNPFCYTDATGLGDPVVEILKKSGARIKDVKITAFVKTQLIENMMLVFEQKRISYPHVPEIISELLTYAAEKTPSGNVVYSAPAGYHDDIVMSIALALKSDMTGQIKYVEL